MTRKISITIRAGASPHGPDLSFPQAISELRGGRQVTVVPVAAAAGADPRGEPVPGFDVTVYPARTSAGRDVPPKVNWGSKGCVPAAATAMFAATLTLASQLAQRADPGDAPPGHGSGPGTPEDADPVIPWAAAVARPGRRDPS